MTGIDLVYLALAAMFGSIAAGLLAAFSDMAGGGKWDWNKFAISIITAVVAGAAYAKVGNMLPATTDLGLAILNAVAWGAGLNVLGNKTAKLLVKLHIK